MNAPMTSVSAEAATAAPKRSYLPELISWLILAACLVVLPSFGSVYVIYMVCLIAINIIATVGLNITVGYTGLLSIGHSAFLGVGAYASALMWLHLGTPLIVNMLVGGVAAFVIGLIFGVPALRIRGVYLAIATLAAQYFLYFIFQQWTSVTGGDRGLSLPRIDVFGLGDTGFYYVVMLTALIACIAARNVFRTRVGRSFIAVREKDYAAEVLGINVIRTKLIAFGIGAAFAGVAGSLLAVFLRIVNPDQFTLVVSVFFLAAVVVGGRASILGSILGAVFMTLMPEILRFVLEHAAPQGADLARLLSPLREILFGALIVGFLIFEPRGLVGLVRRAFGDTEAVEARAGEH
jgi:branched-chain amino acid transport system permease protein